MSEFPFDLPFHKTKFGLFLSGYKDLTQNQLQKALLKFTNETEKAKSVKTNPHSQIEFCRMWFYKTINGKSYPVVLERKVNKDDGLNNEQRQMERLNQLKNDAKLIFYAYMKRAIEGLKIIEEYYKSIKALKIIEKRMQYNNAALEKTECPHCKALVTKANISRHLKTSVKCKAFIE